MRVKQQCRDIKAAVALPGTVERDVPVDHAAQALSGMQDVRGVHVEVHDVPRPGLVSPVTPGQRLQAAEQRSGARGLAHGGVHARLAGVDGVLVVDETLHGESRSAFAVAAGDDELVVKLVPGDRSPLLTDTWL
jgi:hypothetical protein